METLSKQSTISLYRLRAFGFVPAAGFIAA
jgi:hypothetical protein